MRLVTMTAYGFIGFLAGGVVAVVLDLVAIGWLLPMGGAALGGGLMYLISEDKK